MNGYTFEQFLDTIKSRFDVALAGVEAVRPQKKANSECMPTETGIV